MLRSDARSIYLAVLGAVTRQTRTGTVRASPISPRANAGTASDETGGQRSGGRCRAREAARPGRPPSECRRSAFSRSRCRCCSGRARRSFRPPSSLRLPAALPSFPVPPTSSASCSRASAVTTRGSRERSAAWPTRARRIFSARAAAARRGVRPARAARASVRAAVRAACSATHAVCAATIHRASGSRAAPGSRAPTSVRALVFRSDWARHRRISVCSTAPPRSSKPISTATATA